MIAKKYNADKEQGEIEIYFSKQEIKKQDVVAICDYFQKAEGDYEICIFLGLTTYEEVKPYKTIRIKCNYTDLKEKLVSWWKMELENGAGEKLIDFVNNEVRPNYISKISEICKTWQVELSNEVTFEVMVYKDKTIYYEITTIRTWLAAYNKSHDEKEIVRCITDLKGELGY